MKEFLLRLKFVKFKDLLSFILLIVSIPFALIFKNIRKDLWLICERENEARDNGYWLFKYIKENYPNQDVVYAINKKSPDFKKVEKLGKTIKFGGIKHWIYYLSASRNISSQKEGKPNAAVCFILEVYFNMIKNRVYLRHGIAKDRQRWVYYDVSKINLFVCSAKREYDFVMENFGYPKENVKLLGLCRYDNLLKQHETEQQILIMPTWREWLGRISSDTLKFEKGNKFTDSEFFVTWNSLLNNEKLQEILMTRNIRLIFFPHSGIQRYISEFSSNCSNILIASSKDFDVQDLLIKSRILITDYSSIYFDFAYMKKPLLYYHFDYDKYRKGQYEEGYFDYHDDGFGKVCYKEDDLIDNIIQLIENGMRMDSIYKERVDSFFTFNDNKNCERTYKAIKEMECNI